MRPPDVDYTPLDPDYRAHVERLFYSMPFVNHLGIKILDFGPGWLDCGMENVPEAQQQNGFLHAGVIATLADMSAGVAAATLAPNALNTLSVEFKIALLKPLVGQRALARGRVIKPGKTISVAESWIYSVNGDTEKLCARGYLTLAIV